MKSSSARDGQCTRGMNTSKHLPLVVTLSLVSACMGAPVEDTAESASAVTTISASPLSGIQLPPLQLARPTLTGFTPASGRVGDRIVLQGTFLDRSRGGRYVLAGGLGYAVTFAGTNNTRVTASAVTLVSATSVSVTVPAQAATGPVQLVDGLGVLSASPTNFTVVAPPPPPPAQSFLRIVNSNQYDLVSVALNGVSVATCANPIAPGSFRDFPVMPGLATAAVVAGSCVGGVAQSLPPSALVGQINVGAGATATLSLAPFTIGELMTNWGFNSGQWSSGLFVGNDGNFHENSFFFDLAGRWSGRQDGTTWASGTATVVSWPARAQCVSFRLAGNAPVTQICSPFSGFVFDGLPHTRL